MSFTSSPTVCSDLFCFFSLRTRSFVTRFPFVLKLTSKSFMTHWTSLSIFNAKAWEDLRRVYPGISHEAYSEWTSKPTRRLLPSTDSSPGKRPAQAGGRLQFMFQTFGPSAGRKTEPYWEVNSNILAHLIHHVIRWNEHYLLKEWFGEKEIGCAPELSQCIAIAPQITTTPSAKKVPPFAAPCHIDLLSTGRHATKPHIKLRSTGSLKMTLILLKTNVLSIHFSGIHTRKMITIGSFLDSKAGL